MTPSMLRFLLLLSFPLLAGLGAAGLLVANLERRQQLQAARIAGVQPRSRRPAAAVRIARRPEQSNGMLDRLAALFGCDLRHTQMYPLRWWWLVPAGASLLGRLAVALALPLLGPFSWLLLPAATVLVSRSLFDTWESQRRDMLRQQFPDALATVVRSVRVGIPVSEAIRLVAHEAEDPTGHEFRQVASELSIGVPLDAALYGMSERTGLADYRFFATTVALQAQTGGTLGESLETLADIVRRRIALRARGYALTSEARASAMVLCAMPFFAAGMMFVLNPGYMSVLITTESGHKLLGIATLSMAIGVAAMRGLIRKMLA